MDVITAWCRAVLRQLLERPLPRGPYAELLHLDRRVLRDIGLEPNRDHLS